MEKGANFCLDFDRGPVKLATFLLQNYNKKIVKLGDISKKNDIKGET